MKFTPPPWFRQTIERIPGEQFAVGTAPLAAKLFERDSIPGSYDELLSTHKLDYDAVTAEAERRMKALGAPDALKALSSLVEESPGDAVLARDVAFSATQWGLGDQAYHLFRRVAASRPY
jgi:hypothetical protein